MRAIEIDRNKKSLTLNLKHPKGQRIFAELVKKSDVLIENFRSATLERLGFSKECLCKLNPDLVHCSVTGYGERGPAASKPAYDLVLQAESGWMSITGEPDGPPLRIGVAILDLLAAHYAVQGILASLWARRKNGLGQYLEIAMFDVSLVSLCYMAQNYLATGQNPTKMGSQHPSIVPYQAFETRDGFIVVAVASEAIWTRFCKALRREDLANDPRFIFNAGRVEHRVVPSQDLEKLFRTRPSEDWIQLLELHDVPVAAVNDLSTAMSSAQTQVRNLFQWVEHPSLETVKMLRSPLRFSRFRSSLRHAPPMLGQHNEAVLKELGYTSTEVERLQQEGFYLTAVRGDHEFNGELEGVFCES